MSDPDKSELKEQNPESASASASTVTDPPPESASASASTVTDPPPEDANAGEVKEQIPESASASTVTDQPPVDEKKAKAILDELEKVLKINRGESIVEVVATTDEIKQAVKLLYNNYNKPADVGGVAVTPAVGPADGVTPAAAAQTNNPDDTAAEPATVTKDGKQDGDQGGGRRRTKRKGRKGSRKSKKSAKNSKKSVNIYQNGNRRRSRKH
jgi:hypothetical protein